MGSLRYTGGFSQILKPHLDGPASKSHPSVPTGTVRRLFSDHPARSANEVRARGTMGKEFLALRVLESGRPMRYRHLIALFAFAMLAGAGCQVVRDAEEPVLPLAPRVAHRPQDDTVILVVNGGDPLHLAHADAFARQFRADGYPYAEVAEWHQENAIEQAVREVHRDNPDVRIVLIGYSLGAYCVRDITNRLNRDGIPVLMVGYIGADYLVDSGDARLEGISRVVNVTGDGHFLTGKNLFFNGTDVSGARNVRLAGTRHFDLLNHPQTFGVMFEELERLERPES